MWNFQSIVESALEWWRVWNWHDGRQNVSSKYFESISRYNEPFFTFKEGVKKVFFCFWTSFYHDVVIKGIFINVEWYYTKVLMWVMHGHINRDMIVAGKVIIWISELSIGLASLYSTVIGCYAWVLTNHSSIMGCHDHSNSVHGAIGFLGTMEGYLNIKGLIMIGEGESYTVA